MLTVEIILLAHATPPLSNQMIETNMSRSQKLNEPVNSLRNDYVIVAMVFERHGKFKYHRPSVGGCMLLGRQSVDYEHIIAE